MSSNTEEFEQEERPDFGLEFEADFEPDYEVEDPDEDYAIYRFICLEGIENIGQVQNMWASKWKWAIEASTSQWDIVDKELKKFMEVKVSSNPVRYIDDFMTKCQGNTNNYSLAIIDTKFGTCQWHAHRGGLQGETKVQQFIIRSQVMIQLGLLETTLGNYVQSTRVNTVLTLYENKQFILQQQKQLYLDFKKNCNSKSRPTYAIFALNSLFVVSKTRICYTRKLDKQSNQFQHTTSLGHPIKHFLDKAEDC